MSAEEYLENDLTYEHWTRALRDGILLGQRCGDCGHETGAPKAACARCGSRDLETVELPTTGTVYTEPRLSVVPKPFADDDGYQVAVVELGDARVMARIDGTVEIGAEVTLQGMIEANGNLAPVFG